MAKNSPAATEEKVAAPTPGSAIAVRSDNAGALATALGADFFEDAAEGGGFEGVDQDSVGIPFLAILQKNSPQCDPDDPAYNPDAKPGMFMNTVTNELYNGKDGILIVPCAFQRKWLRWKSRETGGGFRGELTLDEVMKMRSSGSLVEFENRLYMVPPNEPVNPKLHDKVADTRVHYILFLNPKRGVASQMVLSLSSTQIKRSKQLLALLADVKVHDAASGRSATPATFANIVRLTSIGESNEKGSWSGVVPELHGFLTDPSTYQMARAFNKLVTAGRAEVNFDNATKTEGEEGSGARRNNDDGRGF